MVALPAICATYGMLPSRYLPTGDLAVEDESVVCVGGAYVRRGILSGVMVTVKSIPYNLTGSSGSTQQVTSDVQVQC